MRYGKKYRLGEVDADAVIEVVKRIGRVVMVVREDRFILDATKIALGYGITVYDALYIAAAKSLGLKLVTADKRRAEAASKAGVETLCIC